MVHKAKAAKGVLYLVGVPIGNYDDMTFHAVNILKKVDIIAAEDTRKAKRLLVHFQIKAEKLIAHHAHNEAASSQGLLPALQEGKSIAFISDAGMPTISDPGHHLATAIRATGGDVKIIPGVSAVSTAIAASGLPVEDFRFVGFPPRKKGQQATFFERLKHSPSTLILFEAPRRAVGTLKMMLSVLGNRPACLCRELTKTYEEVQLATLKDLIQLLEAREEVLGEITLVVGGQTEGEDTLTDAELEALIKKELQKGQSPKSIRDTLSSLYSIGKKELYQKILSLK